MIDALIWPARYQRCALVAEDLSEDQVQCLDRGGAFCTGVDLGVADVPLNQGSPWRKPEPPSV